MPGVTFQTRRLGLSTAFVVGCSSPGARRRRLCAGARSRACGAIRARDPRSRRASRRSSRAPRISSTSRSRTTAPGSSPWRARSRPAPAARTAARSRPRAPECECHRALKASRPRASPGSRTLARTRRSRSRRTPSPARVTELYAHFADPVPVAVRRLDYLDREAQLRSLAGQGKAVPPVVARLAATWAPLRPSVVGHGGGTSRRPTPPRRRDAAPRDGPGSAFRREAVNGLNIVDELEAVFSR